MPVETATYVSQLNASYPLGSDDSGDGDNHLRLLKNVLKNQFPEFTAAALNATQAELEAAIDAVTGLAVLLMKAGTVAAPGLAVVGDTNTGLYAPGADQLAVAVGGLQALLVGSDKSLTVRGALTSEGAINSSGKVTSTGSGKGFDGPGCVPVGAVIEWYSDTLPDSAKYGVYAWANGTTVSAATYTELAALWPSRVSGGNITLPDRRDNTAIGKATMGGAADPGRISTYGTSTLFDQIGEGAHQLTIPELPAHSHTITDPGHDHGISGGFGGASSIGTSPGANPCPYSPVAINVTPDTTGITINNTGSNTAHNIVQPGVVCNFIVRIA